MIITFIFSVRPLMVTPSITLIKLIYILIETNFVRIIPKFQIKPSQGLNNNIVFKVQIELQKNISKQRGNKT